MARSEGSVHLASFLIALKVWLECCLLFVLLFFAPTPVPSVVLSERRNTVSESYVLQREAKDPCIFVSVNAQV